MKKILFNMAVCFSTISFSQTQWISYTGAKDAFLDGSTSLAGINPVMEETNFMAWDNQISKPIPSKHALKGIYWSQSNGTDTSLVHKSAYQRIGDGQLTYQITQLEGENKPIRISFGAYAIADTATKSTPFTLDLSQNPKLELKISNKFHEDINVQIKLVDIKGTILQTYNEYLEDPENLNYMYRYFILEPISKYLGEKTFLVDFSQTNGSEFIFNPLDTYKCNNLPLKKTPEETGFDFTQVKYLDIIITSTLMGSPEECYPYIELSDAIVSISDFKLGTPNLTTSANDDHTPHLSSNTPVTIFDMMGKLVTQGNFEEIHLNDGLYIVKSENKTFKLLKKN